jgi:tetratricopeptide (TPR) repeat protein
MKGAQAMNRSRGFYLSPLRLASLSQLCISTTVLSTTLSAVVLCADDHKPELPHPSPEVLQRLIKQLGHDDYYLRRKAESVLIRYRFDAVDALETAAQSDDAEISSHAQLILDTIRSNWATPDDPPKVAHILAELDLAQQQNENPGYQGPNAYAGQQFERLITLPDEQGLPAACRLLRYGPSLIESKQLTLLILNMAPSGKPPTRAQADKLKQALAGSNRDAVRWILCWLRTVDEPLAMTSDWSRLVAEEERLLARGSDDTSPEIVGSLLRLQIAWLRKLDRKQDSIAAFGRLMRLEKDKPDVLQGLLSWLIEQEDWTSVELVAKKFADTIGSNASLLYLLAEARTKHGDQPGAEAMVAAALNVSSEKDNASLAQHLMTAWQLEERGRMDWAARELRYIVANQPPTTELGLRAAFSLSDLLHEDESDAAAGDVLKQIVDAYPTSAPGTALFRDLGDESVTLGNMRARMNFCYACDAAARKDFPSQRKFLDKALEGDAYDIEVLIAAFQLPDSPPAFRRDISQRIERMASNRRERIADNSSDPSSARWCNEFAWLVGNTEGDMDEALTYAKSAVEFRPTAGGYYDTLARVYVAKGDFASALLAQTKAIKLMPYNKAIQREYEILKKKVSKKL